jgi:NTP pyrophosphatase (non-canonical NTP hydrolase)
MITDELKNWISAQDGRLNQFYPSATEREEILARMTKLTEEVGELADEVLASSGYQRQEKLDAKESDALAKEFADVIITTLLLAKTMKVDVPAALRMKIEKIDARFEKLQANE